MNSKTKRELRNKTRLTCGLVNILKYDIDNLVSEADEGDLEELVRTMQDAKETLQNIADIVAEIEYLLYLSKFGGS